jgi:arylsulfatase A-like enzyme
MNGIERTVGWLGIVLAVMAGVSVREVVAARPPNIVLILADDLGWKDLGYTGSDFMESPVIDRLARQGCVFTNAYSAAGNCAPSRACLLSGLYTPRHEVYAVGSTDRGPKAAQRMVPVPNRQGLGPRFVTVAEALRAAGYATGHFGKWHLAGRDGALPTEQGFDVSFDSFGSGEEPEGAEGNKTGPPTDPKGVFTLSRKACAFMEQHRQRPFFVYLSHHAIHTPQQAQPDSLARFTAKAPGEQHKNALYAACTYDFDASVQLVLDKLQELGLEEDTLLVLTSDNGATQASSQEPLRGSKGGYYEGGIRVPWIMRWSGKAPAGRVCETPVQHVDLWPTFLAAAATGTAHNDAAGNSSAVDGESLLPLLLGEQALQRSSLFWHFPGYLDKPVIRGRELDVRTGFRSRPVSVIRRGDWKLHLYHEEWQLDGGRAALGVNRAVELYNLADDIGEQRDLAAERPQQRDALLDELLGWMAATEAKLPTQVNPAYAGAAQQ